MLLDPALDPDIATLLARIRRADRAPFETMTPAEARIAYRKASRVLDIAPRPLPRASDHVLRTRDGTDLRVRLYAATEDDALPAMLYFHGGGFTIGSIETHDALCRMLADESGCIVVSVDYRLAPEHRFPTAVHDAHDALHWMRRHAGVLGFDPSRFAIGGDSAGGTLAAVTAIQARDEGIACVLQLLVYPGLRRDKDSASRHALAEGFLLDATTIDWFFDQYAPTAAERDDWRFAPLDGRGPDGRSVDLTGVAPACIVTAGFDPLHDEGVAYAARLAAAGVAVRHLDYEGLVHGFIQFAGAIPAARRAQQDIAAALRVAFATPSPPGFVEIRRP
ncbi:MAG: alpha/beta hydrolase [Burkholderiaceae bacterium]